MSGLAIKTDSPCGVRGISGGHIDDRKGRELAIFSNGFEEVEKWVNDWN